MKKPSKKCHVTLEAYLSHTFNEFKKLKEERWKNKPTDEETREGWKKFFEDFSNRDLLKNWSIKELRGFIKKFNNDSEIMSLIRLFANKFVNKVKTPLGEYLIEKTIFEPPPLFRIRKSETGDYKIGIENDFIVICKKEMVKYFCCGPLVPTWKVVNAIDPADVKIKKFDWKFCSLEIKILCPNCKKALIA